jgi:hypothetical protein
MDGDTYIKKRLEYLEKWEKEWRTLPILAPSKTPAMDWVREEIFKYKKIK